MSKRLSLRLLLACLVLACGCLIAQPAFAVRSAASSTFSNQATNESNAGEQAVPVEPGKETEVVPRKTEHAEGAEEEEENAQFKYSSLVRKFAAKTGLSKEAAYWTFVAINFGILAAAGVFLIRRSMPSGFAPRTAEIQRSIEDARKASADASARLSEIEGRLAVLDREIDEIRRAAESDFSAEEQRIRADAERDAKHVIATAEQEIAAASRSAQRDLKAYAAGLAIDLAEKKIKVDETTDEAIIRSFASQLSPQQPNGGLAAGSGKDGQ